MNKGLIITLAVMLVLSISCTAFAGPFADVPRSHWAYDAVNKLAKDGIVDGYNNGTFLGEKAITRYEMAQIVAKAMEKSKKADAEDRALINRLATEFAQELNNLGVRVSALESKVDNVKFSGEVRFRYDKTDTDGIKDSLANSHSYLDLWATAKINDTWVAKAEIESKKNQNGVEQLTSNGNTTRIFATGPAFGGTLTMGKFNPFSAYGLVIDDSITGGQFEFGNKLKTRLAYGKLSASSLGSSSVVDNPYEDVAGSKYGLAELDYALSPVTNVKAAYHRIDVVSSATTSSSNSDDIVTYYEGGFDTKLGSNWGVVATASKSDIDVAGQDNKGYFAQLKYKEAAIAKPGSYDLFYNYRKIPTLAEIDSTWDYAYGVKGNQFGIEYIPMTNSKITAFYLNGNLLDDTNTKYKVYRAQIEFFF
ncbi:MAG: S-layer protein [Firmicutes bacterium]|nr:S-layer protein [Bacillota bacterium]